MKRMSFGIPLAIAISVSVGGCDPTPDHDLAVGYIANVEMYGDLDRYPVRFDHDAHTRTLGDKSCSDCHHEYDKSSQKLTYIKGKEKSCIECHKLEVDGATPALMEAYHDQCISCHEDRASEGKKAGPETCAGCHEQNEFPAWVDPVPFDHARHLSVMEAGQSCDRCHHVWDATAGKTVYVKGKEEACDKCHREPMQNNARTGIRLAVHTACFGCHRTETEAGKKAGPTVCAGCHDPKLYPLRPSKPGPGQPRFEKVDLLLIGRDGSIMPGVPFDHAKHQQKTPDCIVCHTAHVFAMADYTEHMDLIGSRCNLCHLASAKDSSEDARNRLAAGLTPEAAYHDEKAPASCIGCHTARETKGPRTLKPCTGCHSGEEGLKVLKKDATPTLQATVWPDKGPESYLINRIADKYDPVVYPHAKHQEMLVNCETCHHYVKPEMTRTPPCYTCHGPLIDPTEPGKPALVGSYHQMCLGCHRDMGMGPAACVKCHQKKG